MALRPNLQQRGRSRHLICEFVVINTFQNVISQTWCVLLKRIVSLAFYRKGAGPKKARSDQWELTVTPDSALIMSRTMTEIHFLLNDLPASTSHTIPSSATKWKETAAKKRKTVCFHFWEICSHHWTFWCHGRLISNCILKKTHKCSSSKAHTFAFLTILCKEIPMAAFSLIITVLSDIQSLFSSLDIHLFFKLISIQAIDKQKNNFALVSLSMISLFGQVCVFQTCWKETDIWKRECGRQNGAGETSK